MSTSQLIPIAQQIWDMKYRLKAADGTSREHSIEDSWQRVAKAGAKVEGRQGGDRQGGGRRRNERSVWRRRFYDVMSDFSFLPAGRILAGAGTKRHVTLFNCFVMGTIDDDLSAIFNTLRDSALTMQQGGGIGLDFSTLRPKGAPVRSIGADASGPVSFMDVWDAMCRTIMSAGARRGAMMATLACDHPDIEDFIDAKADAARLRNFNLSVLISDAFIEAINKDQPWPLQFDGKVYRTVAATDLWHRIMRASYDFAEPGVIFIDRINAQNNLSAIETICATNPCGEQPLPPFGACLLGSINLTRLIDQPFTAQASLNTARLEQLVATSVRLLDNMIDVSRTPLPAQAREAKSKRRIGLGLTGLADALIMCGLRYDSAQGRVRAGDWMAQIQHAAYLASTELAWEKGAFPLFDKDQFLRAPGIARLPKHNRKAIAKHGIRNGLLTSIAPTGTISLLAGNVSSGIEPVFDLGYQRRILGADGKTNVEQVDDYAYRLFRTLHGSEAPLPDSFVTVQDLQPRAHLDMQAALQPHVDSSISKTINCAANISFDAFKDIYLDAFNLGLKGCTTYRPNDVTGSVLAPSEALTGSSEAHAAPSDQDQEQEQDENQKLAQAQAQAKSAPGRTTSDVVYMAKPLERHAILEGFTYKLRWPGSDHAIYVTINDIEQSSRRRPFEIFINSKNLEHYAWTVALTRMISAVFRRGGDVTFVVDELKAIFDPQGGQWMGGRYVPSLIAAIGEIIETHMIRIGFLQSDVAPSPVSQPAALQAVDGQPTTPAFEPPPQNNDMTPQARIQTHQAPPERAPAGAQSALKTCPHCQRPALDRKEGCWICRDCGYSRCS